MPGGYWFSVLFFLMLSVAGITSMVGLVEAVTAWIEERFNLPRHQSTILVVGSIAVFSIVSILSYNALSHWALAGRNFNDVMDVFFQ